MSNCRLTSLIIVLHILLVLPLIQILAGKTLFQFSKGSHKNPFQYYNKREPLKDKK